LQKLRSRIHSILGRSISRPIFFTAFVITFLALLSAEPALARGVKHHKTPLGAASDYDLVDDISRRAFRYFWEQTDPHTGLVLDRARTDAKPEDVPRHQNVASIAATGFGLTAMCIGAEHRWISPGLARERVRTTLRFFAYQAPQAHGWFYHYMDATTGERQWKSEASSIDTAFLLAGILTARQAFRDDPQIVELATQIYSRIDFPWMLNGSWTTLSHGWKPETGFLRHRWDTYSEHMILYLLAIGSPTHPITPEAWYTWKLPVVNWDGHAYIGGGPLFIQQYSQAWVDLRDRSVPQAPPVSYYVPRVNYFANAVAATQAQQAFGADLSRRFPGYSSNVWGITASDSSKGYVIWGASPRDPKIDGTVVPSAAAGSLMFTPKISIPALRTMLVRYGKKIYGRYGFADAFNPTNGWVSHHAFGIDLGITLLSAENLRTGDVWRWFMGNVEAERALNLVGLVRTPSTLLAPAPDVIPKMGQADSEPVAENSSPGAEILTQVAISPNAEIPASSFEFEIPIPPSAVDSGASGTSVVKSPRTSSTQADLEEWLRTSSESQTPSAAAKDQATSTGLSVIAQSVEKKFHEWAERISPQSSPDSHQ
jgi:hypothetical protein